MACEGSVSSPREGWGMALFSGIGVPSALEVQRLWEQSLVTLALLLAAVLVKFSSYG